MPKNKNAMTRYKILDELLSNRYHCYSLDDLTEEVNRQLKEMDPDTDGVVRRTIEKDINYLEYGGPFMVEIERYIVPGYGTKTRRTHNKQCLRYSDRTFSIFKKDFSKEEAFLLNEALSMLGQFDGLPGLDGLERLRQAIGTKDYERRVISFTKNPLENSNLFGELFTATTQRQVIELHYHTFANPDAVLAVNIHPYLLKEYNRRWFLFGATETNGDLLCFSLDRIDGVVPLPSHEYIDYDGDINELFEDVIGVTVTDGPVLKIVFWVSDVSMDYVLTKPIHESQRYFRGKAEEELRRKYEFLSGGKFFRIDCKENYELIRELMSFGQELIVLEPTMLQEKITRKVSEMKKLYEKCLPRT